jgi:hypothetical protein
MMTDRSDCGDNQLFVERKACVNTEKSKCPGEHLKQREHCNKVVAVKQMNRAGRDAAQNPFPAGKFGKIPLVFEELMIVGFAPDTVGAGNGKCFIGRGGRKGILVHGGSKVKKNPIRC